jgi:hypothetical protein
MRRDILQRTESQSVRARIVAGAQMMRRGFDLRGPDHL